MHKNLITFSLLSLAFGCAAADDQKPTLDGTPLAFSVLARVQSSGFLDHARTVIRDNTEWAEAWPKLATSALPAIDFTQETVVIAAMGGKPEPAYDIYVDSASDVDGNAFVLVVENDASDAGCGFAQVPTSPATAVVLPVASDPVQFVEWKTHVCTP